MKNAYMTESDFMANVRETIRLDSLDADKLDEVAYEMRLERERRRKASIVSRDDRDVLRISRYDGFLGVSRRAAVAEIDRRIRARKEAGIALLARFFSIHGRTPEQFLAADEPVASDSAAA